MDYEFKRDIPSPSAYPLVDDQADPEAAYRAYSSLDSLLRYRSAHQGDQICLVDLSEAIVHNEVSSVKTLTYAQVNDLAERIADHYAGKVARLRRRERGGTVDSVAFLGKSDVSYVLNELGLMRLGHAALHLDTNLAGEAILKLLGDANASHILVDSGHASMAEELQRSRADLEVLPMLDLHDILSLPPPSFQAGAIPPEELASDTSFHLHSSGTTGLPKLITYNPRAILTVCALPISFAGDHDAVIAPPMSHAYPRFQLFIAMARGRQSYLLPACVPSTGRSLFRLVKLACAHAKQTSDVFEHGLIVYMVPAQCSMLANEPDFESLKPDLHSIVLAGGATPRELSQKITEAGIYHINLIGSSEGSNHAISGPERAPRLSPAAVADFGSKHESEWFRISPGRQPYIVMEVVEEEGGLYEMVIHNTWPALHKMNRPDGYATGDLFVRRGQTGEYRHHWKHVGRTDDILVHSTGYKTMTKLPEQELNALSFVEMAVIVGSRYPRPAVLLVPKDQMAPEEVRQLLPPHLERINSQLPTQSKLIMELVAVLPAGTSFQKTSKGSLKRNQTVQQYSQTIAELYAESEGSSTRQTPRNTIKTDQDMRDLVHGILREVSEKYKLMTNDTGVPQAETDLWSTGLDSLTAVRIRNRLQRELQLSPPLRENVVYEQRTVISLVKYLWERTQDADPFAREDREQQEVYKKAWKLLEESRARLSPRSAAAGSVQTVLLTGATGSIGAHILYQLVSLPLDCRPEKIILPVRQKGGSGRERLAASLRLRGLADCSNDDCLQLVDYETGLENIENVDLTIHAAWPVRFDLPLDMFADEVLRTAEWINRTRGQFIFLSSISAFSRSIESIPEAIAKDPASAEPTGYGLSKWVVEQLLGNVSDTQIVRVGQIVGDTVNGIWSNTQETQPSIVRTAEITGCVPDRDVSGDGVSWLPVDLAASAIVDIALSSSAAHLMGGNEALGADTPTASVYNLVAPALTPWDVIVRGIEAGLGRKLEMLPYDRWVERLQAAKEGTVPAANTLNWWESHQGAVHAKRYAQGNLFDAVPAARDWHAIEEGDMVRYMQGWRSRGFLG